MKVKEITSIMNGYNIVEIIQQGSSNDNPLFIGRVDEYWEYPFKNKFDELEIAHISPDGYESNTLRIIARVKK